MKNKVIGLVDDEDVFHWIVKKYVEKMDASCEFLSFYNGDEIYQYLLSAPDIVPDILLLDLNMPVSSGWQFLENYVKTERTENIDIYIVSSSIDPQDKEKADQFTVVTDFISKPISNEFIMAALKKINAER